MEGLGSVDDPTISQAFTIFRICLTVFGLLANTVTGVVLTNRKIWSPTSMMLFSLVAYDAAFLLASIPLCVMDVTQDAEAYAILLGICYPLRYMAQTGSIYTTVTVTIQRFLIVLRPLKARVSCTFGNTRKVVLGLFLFSVSFNIPRCFFYHLLPTFPFPQNVSAVANASQSAFVFASPQDVVESGDGVNQSVQQVTKDDGDRLFYEWLYLRVYELYITNAFFYLLPYSLIPILNLQLLLAIKKRRRETGRISARNKHQVNFSKPTDLEDGLTMIVLGITVCFFVCCLIPAIYNVTQIAEVPSDTELYYYLLTASDTMLCINASTDFFFYCLLGRRFRNIFLHIFCQRPYIRKSQDASSHYQASHKNSETCYHSV